MSLPPNPRTLLHTVAKMHYLQDLSQIEVARRLSLSAATVSRLLKRAREEGIVRIEVRDPDLGDDLGARLADALGLRAARVVAAPVGAGALAALAEPVGQMLVECGLAAGSVLGLGWGRTVWDIVRRGSLPLPGVTIVPCSGGLDEPEPQYQVNEMVRVAAAQTSGVPRFIHAPYLPSEELRASILADPGVRASVELWERLDAAVVGIGLPQRIDRALGGTATTPRGSMLLDAAGDVVQHYFDRDGTLLAWPGDARLLAISVRQLRQTPVVIGVAASVAKAQSILGAVRAKLINMVVTDIATAEAVLELKAWGT